MHVTSGRVRARLADGTLTLDELSLAGGDGRFTAHGTLATPSVPAPRTSNGARSASA